MKRRVCDRINYSNKLIRVYVFPIMLIFLGKFVSEFFTYPAGFIISRVLYGLIYSVIICFCWRYVRERNFFIVTAVLMSVMFLL